MTSEEYDASWQAEAQDGTRGTRGPGMKRWNFNGGGVVPPSVVPSTKRLRHIDGMPTVILEVRIGLFVEELS